MPDGTVCNPAYLPYYGSSDLEAQIYIGNGYSAFSTATNLLYSPITEEFLQQLFQQNNTTSLEAQVGLVFTTQYFSASFVPYRLQYLSEVHNPNLPVLAVHAALERSFTFAGGVPLTMISPALEGVTFGSDLQILHRQYVHSSFSLLDATTTPLNQLVPVNSQFAFETDPTIGWKSFYRKWVFLTSVTATNVGFATPYDSLYAQPTDVAFGWGVEPPVGFGRLRLSMDLVDLIHGTGLNSRIRVGGSYQFGILELMMGWNVNDFTMGMEFAAPIVNVGIVYEFVQQDIEGGTPETKVATEFSVRF